MQLLVWNGRKKGGGAGRLEWRHSKLQLTSGEAHNNGDDVRARCGKGCLRLPDTDCTVPTAGPVRVALDDATFARLLRTQKAGLVISRFVTQKQV